LLFCVDDFRAGRELPGGVVAYLIAERELRCDQTVRGDKSMETKKKRFAGRAVKKRAGRKRVAAKRPPPTSRQSTRKKRASKSAVVRRKERKVDEARRQLSEAAKELATEELSKTVPPATKKRGADSHVPSRIKRRRSRNSKEQKLEQGLEESMAGSDPVSVTQPQAADPNAKSESED
jgi:hypothetical protein